MLDRFVLRTALSAFVIVQEHLSFFETSVCALRESSAVGWLAVRSSFQWLEMNDYGDSRGNKVEIAFPYLVALFANTRLRGFPHEMSYKTVRQISEKMYLCNRREGVKVLREEKSKALKQLEGNVARLVSHVAELSERLAVLTQENETLQAELAEAREQLATSEEGRRIQSAAVALGATSSDSREARKLISQVLREIEACIALLQT